MNKTDCKTPPIPISAGEPPFRAPRFKPYRKPEPIDRFYWWSWHPLYPYWSKSCWGAPSMRAAKKLRETAHCGGLDVYHNKLVRENRNGTLSVVADDSCRRMDVWQSIKDRNLKPRITK